MSSNSASFRKTLVPYLTKASHIPAPFISAFLLVHLSAPLVANIGGASLSSSVMLLGREYYQGAPRELLLLFGPLGLHVSAAILKRLLSPYPPRPLRSLLSTAGYAALGLLPIHVLIHRVYPSDPTPPISSIGPAQLDFTFVQHALHKWPVRSVPMYGALAGSDGSPKRWEKSRVRTRRILGTAGIIAVMGSLYALWEEPLGIPLPSLLARFDAILGKSIVYRL